MLLKSDNSVAWDLTNRIGAVLIDGGLFTRDFLIEGITATPQWTALDPQAIDRIRSDAVSLFSKLTALKKPERSGYRERPDLSAYSRHWMG